MYMSKMLLYETKTVLAELENLYRSVSRASKSLSKYESYFLSDSHRKGDEKHSYYLKRKGVKGRRYIRKEAADIIRSIKESRYCNELLAVIERDIRLLRELDADFVIPDHDNINERLPKIYQCRIRPEIGVSSGKAAEWKRRMEAEKAKHEPYRPEDLVHEALDGTKMRSLSEVIIANYLLSLGVTFVYELPLARNGKKIWPDFTILSPVDNRTVIIIEHQGAMGSDQYQSKFIKSLLFYLGTDLVPNKDVFFTFSHLNRHLDLRQIDSILRTAFGFGNEKGESASDAA